LRKEALKKECWFLGRQSRKVALLRIALKQYMKGLGEYEDK
jgi:hypothetical protein